MNTLHTIWNHAAFGMMDHSASRGGMHFAAFGFGWNDADFDGGPAG